MTRDKEQKVNKTIDFIDKLLDGAPVEWKALGEVASIYDGTHKTPKYIKEGVPFVSVQNIKDIYGTEKYISDEDYNKYKCKPKKNDLFMTRIGDIGTCAVVKNDEPLAYYVTLALIRVNQEVILPKMLKYIIESSIGKSELYKRTLVHATPIKINLGEIGKILIPIPHPNNPEKSLKIQAEIVRILDAFSELTTELTTELSLRKKQYNYYRDQLLTFKEGDVEWKSLGEVGEFIRGNGLPKSDFVEEGVPAIHYGQIYTYYGTCTFDTISFVSLETAVKLKKVNYGDVVITNTSENIEDVGKALVYLGRKQAVTGGHASIFIPSDKIISKYFAYYTQTSMFDKLKRKFAKGTKVIDVSAKDMAKIMFPIPPLAEQQRIVDILDKFDALTNSITEGLPREIELRQKQYEYYRDKLLSFPKKEESIEE